MDLKLLFLVMAIWVKDNSATVQDTSLELESSSERLLDNVLRRSNVPQIPPRYILKLQKVGIGKGQGALGRIPHETSHGKQRMKDSKNKSNMNKRKNKIKLSKGQFIRKITPVKVILDVEVANSKEEYQVDKLLSN